ATSGAQLARLVAPEPEKDARFGSAVAFSGVSPVVGAPFEDRGAADAGAVDVFDPGGEPRPGIQPPPPAQEPEFGAALAADAVGALVVGAWHDGAAAAGGGAIYVFVDQGVPVTTTTGPTTTSTTTSTTTTTTTTTGVASSSSTSLGPLPPTT